MKPLPILIAAILGGPLQAATLLSDNFDSGAASADWTRRSGITVNSGGPAGSTSYVSINSTVDPALGMGDRIGGADSFIIDYYFRVQSDSVNRQFNLGVSTINTNPSPGEAAVNLRYQSGGWAVYNTAWQPLALGSVTAGQWYHMQFEGTGWGSAGATYTLRLSDAGGTAFTSSVTSSIVQNGQINGPFTVAGTQYPGTAQSFVFSTVYGLNPGFDIDNVIVTGNLIPEPSTIGLAALAAASLLRRRKR